MRDLFVTFILLLAAAVLFAIWVSGSPAMAHEWFTNQANPVTTARCCNNSDCVVIENESWWEENGFIFVKWRNGKTYTIPANQAAPSQDKQGRAAACVWAGKLRCFFMPVNF